MREEEEKKSETLHHLRGFQLPLQILSAHKYTKVNSSGASLQYSGLQRKAISILSLFYCLCCLSLSSPPVGNIQTLYFTALILLILGYRDWHIEMSI